MLKSDQEQLLDLVEEILSYDKLDRVFDEDLLDRLLEFMQDHGRMMNTVALY
jgi:hypothetical protein